MLEAFVHDPLINWRLLGPEQEQQLSASMVSDSDVSSQDASSQISAEDHGIIKEDEKIMKRSDTSPMADIEARDQVTSGVDLNKGKNRPRAMTEVLFKINPRKNKVPTESIGPGSIQTRRERDREIIERLGPEVIEGNSSVLNQRALKVIKRVNDKLIGRDFGNDESLDVASQVQRLIVQATNYENLCQAYIGWCPFW
mmetsp:Transcript_9353/g.10780  ORF Transcript_9353/g.10780 Transcript_9353/m.10780 type:complete len:198 (+) Transcript_9353:1-594(+)